MLHQLQNSFFPKSPDNIPSESKMAQDPTVSWSFLLSCQDEMNVAQ